MPRLIVPTLLAATLAIAACVEEAPTSPLDGDCGASGLSGLVGQNRKVLDTMKFSNPIRVLEPGSVMTMDLNPTRLNIELDAKGTITRLTCG